MNMPTEVWKIKLRKSPPKQNREQAHERKNMKGKNQESAGQTSNCTNPRKSEARTAPEGGSLRKLPGLWT